MSSEHSIERALEERDSQWRTAINRALQPECPAFPGTLNHCDPSVCDCLGELQDAATIDDVVTVLARVLGTDEEMMRSVVPQPDALSPLHVHEALHTASLAADFVERHLVAHPAIEAKAEWRVLAARASTALHRLYQLVGATRPAA